MSGGELVVIILVVGFLTWRVRRVGGRRTKSGR